MIVEEVLQSMPLSMHAIAAIALVCGVITLAFGKRLLRPGLVLVGLVFGAAAGLVAGSMLPYEWSIWIPIGVGAGVFALVALAAYRFVMAFVLAIALGTAAPLAFFTYAEITGLYEGQVGSPISEDELVLPELKQHFDRLDEITKKYSEQLEKTSRQSENPDSQAPDEETDEDALEWRRRLDAIVQAVASTAADQWLDAPGSQKAITGMCMLGGLAAGILIGILIPTVAAAVASSLAGSMIILISGYWLAIRTNLPVESVTPDTPFKWLAMWLILAIIGLVFQFCFGARKADKSE